MSGRRTYSRAGNPSPLRWPLKPSLYFSDSVILNPTPSLRRLLQPSYFCVGMSEMQRNSQPGLPDWRDIFTRHIQNAGRFGRQSCGPAVFNIYSIYKYTNIYNLSPNQQGYWWLWWRWCGCPALIQTWTRPIFSPDLLTGCSSLLVDLVSPPPLFRHVGGQAHHDTLSCSRWLLSRTRWRHEVVVGSFNACARSLRCLMAALHSAT